MYETLVLKTLSGRIPLIVFFFPLVDDIIYTLRKINTLIYFFKQFWGGFYSKLPTICFNRRVIWTYIYQASRLVQSQRLEELPQFSTMVRDRENTFCTSGTYKSANLSQPIIFFSQPIITEYTVFHYDKGQGGHILHVRHLQDSQPITGHYFIQPTNQI